MLRKFLKKIQVHYYMLNFLYFLNILRSRFVSSFEGNRPYNNRDYSTPMDVILAYGIRDLNTNKGIVLN